MPALSPHSELFTAAQRSNGSFVLDAADGRSPIVSNGVPPSALLLTIDEAADCLHVGRCTMQALITSGEVRSLKIGRLRRVPPSALKDYIERQMAL